MAYEVVIPILGVTVETGSILEWRKKEGDNVAKGDLLFIVQTDKVTTEVESQAEGVLSKILLPAGKEVPVLTRVAWITAPGEAVPADDSASEKQAVAAPVAQCSAPAVPCAQAPGAGGTIRAVPAARFLAREKNVSLENISGSGPAGVIRYQDVVEFGGSASRQAAALAASAGVCARSVQGSGVRGRVMARDVALAAADASAPVLGRTLPMSMQRSVIARRLTESKQTAPHVYFFVDAALDALLQLRKQMVDECRRLYGAAPSINDFLIKAAALTIAEFPLFNASLVGNDIRIHQNINVGLAVALPDGLQVPAIPDADFCGIAEIASLREDLVNRARTGKLAPDEVSRGTFTISSLAHSRVKQFAAVINPPQVAILSVPAPEKRVVAGNGAAVERNFVRFGLTVDHRVIDGALAAAFCDAFVRRIENPLFLFLNR